MPTRRRPTQIAAALPASRLPLGTPSLTSHTSHASHTLSQSSGHSSTPPPRSQTPGKENRPASHQLSAKPFTAMGTADAVHDFATGTLAEAKLERQKRRNDQAEAALKPPLPIDHEQQTSRGRKNVKAGDLNPEPVHPSNASEAGAPLADFRVDACRSQSRGTSLARSLSSVSQHTRTSGQIESDQQESALDDAGFRLYTGRRNRKNAERCLGHEDKTTVARNTVEATFDRRVIYEVFGNALPGPEFVEQNVGCKNGQLQFVRHPNGDVSAHQWSSARYIWENIGQYSNVRKKVEGQLAADRLKGETAEQTLHQNTLIYFKTVARQREANVMHLPFGTKDIQEAIPHVRPEQADPLPTSKKSDNRVNIESPSPRRHGPSPAAQHIARSSRSSLQPTSQPSPSFIKQHNRFACANTVPGKPSSRCLAASFNNSTPSARPPDDPFYWQRAKTNQTIYGEYPVNIQSYSNYIPDTRFNSFGGNSDFMLAQTGNHFVPGQNAFTSTSDTLTTGRAHCPNFKALADRGPPDFGATSPGISHDPRNVPGTAGSSAYAPVATPASASRMQMRDHLQRLGGQAEERRRSQDKIRTVLYDPFRDQQISAASAYTRSEITDVLGAAKLAVDTPDSSRISQQTAVHVHRVLAPSSRCEATEHLKNSSPDTYWEKLDPISSSGYQASSSSCEKPTPQNFNGPFFMAITPDSSSTSKHSQSSVNKKAYDQELKNWFCSGNTFMRQEEFYQRIKAADKVLVSVPSDLSTDQVPIENAAKMSTENTGIPLDITRVLIPVFENLASYVQGPAHKRRDYFSQWSQPPEWAIDRSPEGNLSFHDHEWGQPPQRIGRDSRYRQVESLRFGGFSSAQGGWNGGPGLDRRFVFGSGT